MPEGLPHIQAQKVHFPLKIKHRVTYTSLGFGTDVNALAENNWTPLHTASSLGRLEIARLLLDHGAKVDASDEFGQTPLHKVSSGKYDPEEAGVGVAKLLLERGGDVNGKYKQQSSPLHLAFRHGKLEIARLLLNHGANVEALDGFSQTPLHKV